MLKNDKILAFLIILLILGLILNFYLFFKLDSVIEIRKIDSSIIVSESIGFDLNSSALTFGKVTLKGNSARELNFENNFGFPIKVFVYGEGEMNNFIIPFSEKLDIDEKKFLRINAFVPESTELGEYNGKVILKIARQ